MVCEITQERPAPRPELSNEERLRRKRLRWKQQCEDRKLITAEGLALLPARKSAKAGRPELRGDYVTKLCQQVDRACDLNFWGNPSKPWRPKTDPGKGFGHIAFGKRVE